MSINIKNEDTLEENDKIPHKRVKVEICQDVPTSNIENKQDLIAQQNNAKSNATSSKRKIPPIYSKEHFLSGYNKKQILNYLKHNGCSPKSFEQALKSFKVPRDSSLEYLNNKIEEAQANVHQECDSLSFTNINEWLHELKSWSIPQHSYNEHAIITSSIECNEHHPDPQELAGIDLKAIYKFLANAQLGLPQDELNKETAQFLANEFEMLVDEANTDIADKQIRNIKNYLQNPVKKSLVKRSYKLSLDPLLLDEDIK